MQQERVHGGENLIFKTQQEAAAFRESLEQKIVSERLPGTVREREIIAEELAKKFEEQGAGVSTLHTPWEHSQQEHIEVQELVNTAFVHGLSTALRRAEQSDSFPRNIDLFHDVLTGELYDAVLGRRLNTVHTSSWGIVAIAIPVLLLIIAVFVFVYSL